MPDPPATIVVVLMRVIGLCRVIEFTVRSGTFVAAAWKMPAVRLTKPVPSAPWLTTVAVPPPEGVVRPAPVVYEKLVEVYDVIVNVPL